MTQHKSLFAIGRDFIACEKGAAAVEYVVIAAAMFLALMPAFLYVASGTTEKFSSVGGYFSEM